VTSCFGLRNDRIADSKRLEPLAKRVKDSGSLFDADRIDLCAFDTCIVRIHDNVFSDSQPCESFASDSNCSSLAKVTIRMAFEVATPIVMSEPIRDGTFRVVRVRNNIHRIPQP
jgi:hypothetical protein